MRPSPTTKRPAALVHLISIMEDPAAEIDLRIEAAKQILLHCQKLVARYEQG